MVACQQSRGRNKCTEVRNGPATVSRGTRQSTTVRRLARSAKVGGDSMDGKAELVQLTQSAA